MKHVDPWRQYPASMETITASRGPIPPTWSWWTSKDFKAAHERELPRILRNQARVMPSREGEPVQP